jgi:hypothetical protein
MTSARKAERTTERRGEAVATRGSEANEAWRTPKIETQFSIVPGEVISFGNGRTAVVKGLVAPAAKTVKQRRDNPPNPMPLAAKKLAASIDHDMLEIVGQDQRQHAILAEACDAHLNDLRSGENKLASLQLREGVPMRFGRCVLP